MKHHPSDEKLVRDLIPQIIRERGAIPGAYIANPEEYRGRPRYKFVEEVTEVLAAQEGDDALTELADVLEVMHALAADLGSDMAEVETIRVAQAQERGGFADRGILRGTR
ncbi:MULTISPECIES: nucleoside triphosphate pyrophosphohydrolase [Streptomyces]|uniref:Nucleoside triphosphate pyrophosphohydrolase n=1 Tax=Streptomyces ramulosus TaxID=47762 RepID=A0ABW1FVS6_9ACTN